MINQIKCQENGSQQLQYLQVKEEIPQPLQFTNSSQGKQKQRQDDVKSKNNFKWTYEEHAQYIYFLEMNKQKIKSKLIRKSNAFFIEMEKYIKTKTCLQCRSHHQKFQQRYIFPHRIITGQKKHIPLGTFEKIVEQAKRVNYITNLQNQNDLIKNQLTIQPNQIGRKEVCCQTDISDLRLELTQKQSFSSTEQTPRIPQFYYFDLQPYNMIYGAYPPNYR